MLYRLLVIAFLAIFSTVHVYPDSSAGDPSLKDKAAFYEVNGEYELAVETYTESVSDLESQYGPFTELLIEPLLGLARGYAALNDYPQAMSASNRAQHLTHRNDGVYSLRQLEAVDMMTDFHLSLREAQKADKQQSFSLFIGEHNFDEDSPELLPALEKISNWYVDTGQFSRAEKALDRSQTIISSSSSHLDLQHLPSITLRAKIKRLRGSCCSYKVLEEALEIVHANPDTPDEIKTWIYTELADSYTITGNTDGASNYYRLAWASMNEADRKTHFAWPKEIALSNKLNDSKPSNLRTYRLEKDRFSQPELIRVTPQEKLLLESLPPQEFLLPVNESELKVRIRDRSYGNPNIEKVTRVVGHPFQFIHNQLTNILPMNLQSDAQLSHLAVELNFTVGEIGNIYDIEVGTPDLPVKLKRLMREVLRKTKFRPRMVDGEPTETTQVNLYQTFEP